MNTDTGIPMLQDDELSFNLKSAIPTASGWITAKEKGRVKFSNKIFLTGSRVLCIKLRDTEISLDMAKRELMRSDKIVDKTVENEIYLLSRWLKSDEQ